MRAGPRGVKPRAAARSPRSIVSLDRMVGMPVKSNPVANLAAASMLVV